jgi:hypothetical protein
VRKLAGIEAQGGFGICCTGVILPQVRGRILKGRGCMEKSKLIRLGENLQRIGLESATSMPELSMLSIEFKFDILCLA